MFPDTSHNILLKFFLHISLLFFSRFFWFGEFYLSVFQLSGFATFFMLVCGRLLPEFYAHMVMAALFYHSC